MKDSPELRAAIRAASAFRELSDDNLAILIEAAELETFDPDAVLMVQGEPSDYAMLILEGEVTVTADSARGAIPISTLHAPSLVGELGALAQLPRSATARACTPVTALRFGRAALVEVGARDAVLAHRRHRPDGRTHAQVQRRDQPLHGGARRARASRVRSRAARGVAQSDSRPRRFRPDLRPHGRADSFCAVSATTRWRARRSFSARFCPEFGISPKNPRLDVWASMTPARDVGGDFFDLVPLADGRVALGVGDVCGKGVPAALFMGITKTLIRINLRENPDLPGAIVKANAFLADNNAGQLFATAVIRRLRSALGRARILQLRPSSRADPPPRRRGRDAACRRPAGRPVRAHEDDGAQGATSTGRPFLPLHRWRHRSRGPGRVQFGEDRLEGLLAKKGPRRAARRNGLRASRRRCESSRADGPSSTTSPASR